MAKPGAFDKAIEDLLIVGAETWELLLDAGVLDTTDWPDDLKWTAIGMMWGFPARHIAAIRIVKAGAPPESRDGKLGSTHQKMRTVRTKGQRILDSMSESMRLQYRLPRRPTKRQAKRERP